MKIVRIIGRKIIASQGNETVEAEISFTNGQKSSASVPAGISAGKYEIPKVPVGTALEQIEKINSLLEGQEVDQTKLDTSLSSQNFGGNATLAVSAAFWVAEQSRRNPKYSQFPKPLLLLFEGGEHGNAKITIQEFMLVEDTVEKAMTDFQLLKKHLSDNGIEQTVGAEGGFSPADFTNQKVLETIKTVFPRGKIAIDVASAFQVNGVVDYDSLLKFYPIISIEDPYKEDDWGNWQAITAKYGEKILIVGDDLTATNPTRIRQAIESRAVNAVIIKPNQNGTITGTLEAVKIARDGNLKILFSHRGEETDDTWLVDLALEAKADYLKLGGMDRGERIAKYNRLVELGMP